MMQILRRLLLQASHVSALRIVLFGGVLHEFQKLAKRVDFFTFHLVKLDPNPE